MVQGRHGACSHDIDLLHRTHRCRTFRDLWQACSRTSTGEFKFHLLQAQFSLAALITLTWGLLGAEWNYLAVVAVMVWGWGDAAAGLVGKTFGRRKIRHRWVDSSKTIEGTIAMLIVGGSAVFYTLLFYAGKCWYVSLAVTAVVAPLSTVVELVSRKGTDTLTLPLTAATLTFAMILFLPA